MDEEFRRPSQDEGRCLMSEKHTHGPLVLSQHGAIRGGPMVRYINGSTQEQVAMTTGADWMGPGEQLENARRLVACWNACEKVSTEDLEALTRPGDVSFAMTIDMLVRERDHFQALAKDNGSVIVKTACDLGAMWAQRGTLLAALRCAIKKAPELITVPSIRSAIENAEGGK